LNARAALALALASLLSLPLAAAGRAPQEPPPLDPLPAPVEPPPPEGPLLSLAQALTRAREASPDLKVAREKVVQAQNNLSRAYSAFQPTLTANGSYARNSSAIPATYFDPAGAPVNIETQKKDQLSGNLTGQINLFNARAFPALDTAKDQIDLSRQGESQTRRELLLDVAATYLTGVQQGELAAAAFRRAKAARDQARQAEARYQAGLLQRASAVRAQLDVINAEQTARQQIFAVKATRSQLAALIDRRDTAFELETPLAPPPEQRGELQELLDRALRDRPEMAAAALNEQIAARVRTDARAQFLPTLALNGQVRTSNGDLFPGQDRFPWAITLSLSLPLYDGGFRYAQLKDARSQEAQAAAQTRSQALKIEDELRRALLDLETARMLRDTSEQALRVSQENERLVRAQFEAGTSTQIEVSDAEASLFQAEATLLQARLGVQISALRLAKAVGAFDP
jgi:outer membrane protein TolC